MHHSIGIPLARIAAIGSAVLAASVLTLMLVADPAAAVMPGSEKPPANSSGGASVDHRIPALTPFRLGAIDGQKLIPNRDNVASRTTASGPLLLFLPATRQEPGSYRGFLRTASRVGYHVLGLDYWNIGRSVAQTCQTDPACYGAVQRNRLDGTHPSSFSKVDAANSVLSRFSAAIQLLQQNDPTGGWGRFLDDNDRPVWSQIVVAGHSQGGGEAAYIAHRYAVRGALMFSSPIITDRDVAASWLGTPGATPVSRMYAFDDAHDCYYARIVGSWHRLGLDAAGTAVGDVPVATTQHALVSTRELGTPLQSHMLTVNDLGPVNTKGTPVFQPVWHWMLSRFPIT